MAPAINQRVAEKLRDMAAVLEQQDESGFRIRAYRRAAQAVEAMAEGVPVIASNVASLPEVLGSAALLVAPDDIEGLASAMHMLLADSALARRLQDAGRAQAARYTWKACALEHIALYESLMT